VVLHKQIGETAGIGCPEDPAQPFDVNLIITSIQSGVQCDDGGGFGEPLQPDEQMVRFDVDITTAQQFNYPEVNTALFADNWGIGDARGVTPELDQHISLDCRSDQIQKILLPGTHVQKSIVVTAPKSATILRLYLNDDGSGWTWDVPPYVE
jgi:hypothetical protein